MASYPRRGRLMAPMIVLLSVIIVLYHVNTEIVHTLTSRTTPNEIIPSEITPNEIIPSEITPNEIIPSEITPNEIIPSTIYIPNEIISNEVVINKVNVLAFSLYGSDPRYIIGAIENAKLIPLVFSGWKMIVFFDNSVPVHVQRLLQSHNVEMIDMTASLITNARSWRFSVASNRSISRFCSRDIDSRYDRIFASFDFKCITDLFVLLNPTTIRY
jgi:hypothetical protein